MLIRNLWTKRNKGDGIESERRHVTIKEKAEERIAKSDMQFKVKKKKKKPLKFSLNFNYLNIGDKWGKTTITYYIENYTPDMERRHVDADIKR